MSVEKGTRRPITGLIGGLVFTVALAGLSRVPWSAADAQEGYLRLSWRLQGESVEECRPPTPGEAERLPEHMRVSEICEGDVTPYRLTVEADDSVLIDDVVRPAGIRGDRPVFVYRDLELAPGTYDVAVRFEPTDPAAESSPITFREAVPVASGRISLITWQPDSSTLVLKR